MEPFFFDSQNIQKLGIYSPPSAFSGDEKAVLICYPLMQEHIRSYRAIKALSLKLNAAGYHVLRFDYSGTGDSDGELEDVDFDIWQNDIQTAADELKNLSGVNVISVIGLRMGAVLAINTKIADVEKIVLWDPTFSGADYLQHLENMQIQMLNDSNWFQQVRQVKNAKNTHEIMGFVLNKKLYSQIRNSRVLLNQSAAKISVVFSEKEKSKQLEKQLSESQAITIRRVDEAAEWSNARKLFDMLMPVKASIAVLELLN